MMRPSSDPGTLGGVIRRRRLQLGWSQEELAARASTTDDDVRQSDISRLELGKVGLPRRARLQRIAAALEMPLGELLTRSGWAVDAAPVATFGGDRRGPRPAEPHDASPWPDGDAGLPAARRASDAGDTLVRLHDVIAEARMTVARSAAALERAREVYDRAAHPPNRSRRRRGAAEGGGAP